MTPKTFLDKIKLAVIMIAIATLIVYLAGCVQDEPLKEGCGFNRNRCNEWDRVAVRCNDCVILNTTDSTACDNRGGFREWLCDH